MNKKSCAKKYFSFFSYPLLPTTVSLRKIIDDRTVFFNYSCSIYHLEDFMGLENKYRER